MSQENVEIVRGMLSAFNEGDVEAVLAAFDEDVSARWWLEDLPGAGEAARREGVPLDACRLGREPIFEAGAGELRARVG